ncbi:hypothetical protein KLEP7_gp43 [Pseudaeromonas phage vB_PpeM_ KLEP7]|nr:hypothetical protein KLEP7_gp43 [Pseudaeromonas phage vB_PpeM_ KLEP7]
MKVIKNTKDYTKQVTCDCGSVLEYTKQDEFIKSIEFKTTMGTSIQQCDMIECPVCKRYISSSRGVKIPQVE